VQTFEDLRTYDGKERPSTMSQGQTEISEIIDARTRQTTFKKDGKQTYCATSTVSRDGKTMTNRVEGIDDKGKAFEEIQVFNRQ